MTYTKSENDSLNFMECIQLLETLLGYNLVSQDPDIPDNILIYYSGDSDNPEGWYSRNLLSVAADLVNDIPGQNFLRAELKALNISLEFTDVSGHKNNFPAPMRY